MFDECPCVFDVLGVFLFCYVFNFGKKLESVPFLSKTYLFGTWNINCFLSLTTKFQSISPVSSGASDSPRALWPAAACLPSAHTDLHLYRFLQITSFENGRQVYSQHGAWSTFQVIHAHAPILARARANIRTLAMPLVCVAQTSLRTEDTTWMYDVQHRTKGTQLNSHSIVPRDSAVKQSPVPNNMWTFGNCKCELVSTP